MCFYYNLFVIGFTKRKTSINEPALYFSSSDLQLLARSGSFASPGSSLQDQDSVSNISGFSEASAGGGDNSVIVAAAAAAASSPVHRVGTPAQLQLLNGNNAPAATSFRPVTSTPVSLLVGSIVQFLQVYNILCSCVIL